MELKQILQGIFDFRLFKPTFKPNFNLDGILFSKLLIKCADFTLFLSIFKLSINSLKLIFNNLESLLLIVKNDSDLCISTPSESYRTISRVKSDGEKFGYITSSVY